MKLFDLFGVGLPLALDLLVKRAALVKLSVDKLFFFGAVALTLNPSRHIRLDTRRTWGERPRDGL